MQSIWKIKDDNFGPFLPYIKDPMITDINYNGTDTWVEHLEKGIYKIEEKISPEFIESFAVRIANVVSQQLNKYNNVLEAETDTLRISIIHDSATNTGYSVSIRKTPPVVRLTEENAIKQGYCTKEILTLLKNCIKAKMNIVFCGTPGAGKTELLKFLAQFIPKDEKIITIEDNLEIHMKEINPGCNCVELKVNDEFFSYTKAIKTSLRQNAQHVFLSEARSEEVKYLMECLSTGLHGLTTLHTDDLRKVPDRIKNMVQDPYLANRIETDTFTFLNVGVLLRKKYVGDKIIRYIDQICFFDRIQEKNVTVMTVEDGKIINKEIPINIMKKFKWANIENPFMEKQSLT